MHILCYAEKHRSNRSNKRSNYSNNEQKAYKALEYYKIIDLLTDKASSPMGKDLCRKLTPSTDIEEIRAMQLQTHDALARLFKKAAFPSAASRTSAAH